MSRWFHPSSFSFPRLQRDTLVFLLPETRDDGAAGDSLGARWNKSGTWKLQKNYESYCNLFALEFVGASCATRADDTQKVETAVHDYKPFLSISVVLASHKVNFYLYGVLALQFRLHPNRDNSSKRFAKVWITHSLSWYLILSFFNYVRVTAFYIIQHYAIHNWRSFPLKSSHRHW